MAKYVRKKGNWQIAIATAIPKKEKEQQLKPGEIGKDAQKHGIKKSTYESVRSGERIAAKNANEGGEIYAYLYLVWDIKEADPQTIPPLTITTPKGGKTEVTRAWSNERLDSFKKKLEKSGKQQGTKIVTESTDHDRKLIVAFRAIVRDEIRSAHGEEPPDIGLCIKKLLDQFKQTKSVRERDDIAEKYKREITALWQICDAYTHSTDKREEALSLSAAFKEGLDAPAN